MSKVSHCQSKVTLFSSQLGSTLTKQAPGLVSKPHRLESLVRVVRHRVELLALKKREEINEVMRVKKIKEFRAIK